MADETTEKFVANMLKSAKEKKTVNPQTRFEGVQSAEVEELTKNIVQAEARKKIAARK
jgi:hypothetical protein